MSQLVKEVEVELEQHQIDFMEAQERLYVLCGGVGSGKTFAGACWSILMSQLYPKAQGCITANTYKQLTEATLVCFFKLLDIMNIPYHHNISANTIIINNKTKILCLSMEKYDNYRGIEIGWWWGDEASRYTKDGWNVISGRLRDKNGPCTTRFTTTPDGLNWLYDLLEPTISGTIKTNAYGIRFAKTTDNTSLREGYNDELASQYDAKFAIQELEGRFINQTEGNVYHSFSVKNNVRDFEPEHKNFGKVLRAGCDFNVNPMTAVIFYVLNDIIYVVDEIYLTNSNTFQLSDVMLTRMGKGAEVYPDATGRSRKTSATQTDHDIINAKGLKVIYTPNPLKNDRFNCVNGHFQHKRIVIHPRCKWLIKDLERVTHEDVDKPQKNPMLQHISDALGYPVWTLYPLRRPESPSRTISIG